MCFASTQEIQLQPQRDSDSSSRAFDFTDTGKYTLSLVKSCFEKGTHSKPADESEGDGDVGV